MRFPALWIAAAFAAGIGAANRWPESLGLWLAATLVALVLGECLRGAITCALQARALYWRGQRWVAWR